MESAKVGSIEALRTFRAALIKFAETASAAITDADADVRQTLIWLERDQTTYWNGQIRKRHDALERAKEALRHKQIYKSATGERQSVVDELKAMQKAKAALEEAESKLISVKRSVQRLRKQMMEYQGQVQRLMSAAQVDVPAAVAELDRMTGRLDQYVSLRSEKVVGSDAQTTPSDMTRAPATEEQAPSWRDLRKLTPQPGQRAAAESGLEIFGEWAVEPIKIVHRDILNRFDFRRVEIDPEQFVVLQRGLEKSKRIYLERLEPAFVNDSGWYIGSGEESVTDLYTLRVRQVFTMRGDLADVLTLPAGTLVGLDEHGLAAVLDRQDADLWQQAIADEKGRPGESSPVE